MEGVELVRSTKYTTEQVDSALLVLACLGGNTEKTADALKAEGMIITPQCLRFWRSRRYPRRYAALETEHARKIEGVITNRARAIALRLSDVEELALERTQEELNNGNVKDPATVLRNISVSKGINLTKILELEGRSLHHVVVHRTPDEILSSIRASLTLQADVEGEAEEETDAAA